MARAPADQFLKQAPHVSESDRAIIRLLQEDGRRPFVQIARETGLAEKTVRNRVRNLLDDDIIQIAAVTNPQALGYLASALLGITTDPAVPASDIALSLLEIESVDYVVVATGRYGIFAELICRDRETLQAVIENEIGRVPGIAGIESYPYLQIHYQLARFHAAQSKTTSELGVRPRALTDTDRAIIQALSIDGRTPLQTIADDLSISESQVRNRVGDMVDAGVMNVMAIVNPMSVEYGTVAWVAIKVGEGQQVSLVASAMADLSRITYVAICAGRFDIFAEVMCTSEEELLAVMDEDIRMMAGVHRAEASIYQHLHYKRLTPIRDEKG